MGKKPVLVIMAAGMGSRCGGLEQINPVGEYDNAIIDFSISDAGKAGFGKVILIIKKAVEEEFKIHIGNRISRHMDVEYIFQELDKISAGFQVPKERVEPQETAHTVLCCASSVDGPFAAINTNDYYGKEASHMIHGQLLSVEDNDRYQYATVGYRLYNTFMENGYVARGMCTVDECNYLTGVHERIRIEKHGDIAEYTEDGGSTWTKSGESIIMSMNVWGFMIGTLAELEKRFGALLEKNLSADPLKCEYSLPFVVGEPLRADQAQVTVLKGVDRQYGVTYKEDKEMVVKAIKGLKDSGLYSQKLWEG